MKLEINWILKIWNNSYLSHIYHIFSFGRHEISHDKSSILIKSVRLVNDLI